MAKANRWQSLQTKVNLTTGEKMYAPTPEATLLVKPGVLVYDFYAIVVRLYGTKEWLSETDFCESLKNGKYPAGWQKRVVAYMKALKYDKIAELRGTDEGICEIRITNPEAMDAIRQNLAKSARGEP